MATKKRNPSNQTYNNNADGFDISGGTTARKLTVSEGDIAVVGGGSNVITPYNRNIQIGNPLNNYSTSDQTINASTTALLTGSTITVPADKLQIGSIIKFRISLSKTAAGTAAVLFDFRLGTNGTTADTSILQFSLGTATGVADTGCIDIYITIRGPLSSSCIAQGQLRMTHNLSTTGLANVPCKAVNTTSSAFDVTASGLIISLSCTTPASTVLTFQQVITELINL